MLYRRSESTWQIGILVTDWYTCVWVLFDAIHVFVLGVFMCVFIGCPHVFNGIYM